MNFNKNYLLILFGILLFTACKKENIDEKIVDPEDITTTTVLCNMEFDLSNDTPGILTVKSITGGTPPYAYEWSIGETTDFIIVATEGEYGLTVTDAEECIVSKNILVSLCDISSFIVDVNLILNSDTTAYNLIANISGGGTSPFTYLWESGEEIQEIPFKVNPNSVTVTDANGCEASNFIELIDGPCLGRIDQINDTTLAAIIYDGIPPFSYEWSTGETSENIVINNNGDFSVTITDRVGCTALASITVNNDPCFGFRVQIINQPYGTGTLNAVPQNNIGTEPYSYLWSTGETTKSITVVDEGTYYLTTTDANLCEYVDNIHHKFNDPSCEGFRFFFSHVVADQRLKVVPQQGTPPYAVSWSTGETTIEISVMSGNTYTANLTDSEGCCFVKSFTVR